MIEDPEFDLDYHLNRGAVPAPGSLRELEDVIAHINSYPLDHTRPLWQFWVLEGMANGQIVLVQKIHHTLADGMASLNFIMRVWQSGYNDPDAVPPPWQPEPVPSRGRLFWDAVKDHLRYDIRNLPSFLSCMWRSTVTLRRQADAATSPILKGQSGDLPKLRWNYAVTARRSFAMAQLPLDEQKSAKTAIGGTLNDIVLAMVGTSLRNFLLANDELPEKPLLVTVPVSREHGNTGRESGNSTAVMQTLLHVQIADPRDRYDATRASTEHGKRDLEIMGRDTYGLLMHYTPPAVLIGQCQRDFRNQLANNDSYKIPANLSVSNVPGPREKFSARGNVVEDFYSAGPVVDGIGLNITAWSYAGNMNFCLTACMKALPDIHKIADGLEPALRELADLDEESASVATAAEAGSRVGAQG
jgi:WS/DGAT/MGAT family acyltransferase